MKKKLGKKALMAIDVVSLSNNELEELVKYFGYCLTKPVSEEVKASDYYWHDLSFSMKTLVDKCNIFTNKYNLTPDKVWIVFDRESGYVSISGEQHLNKEELLNLALQGIQIALRKIEYSKERRKKIKKDTYDLSNRRQKTPTL